ncbi:hypothetical protein FGO68_gene3284 [Halteria grandinella]|uniref:Casein kinase I n=1 Tax=Halteria grandinella TaxID=5974 RepID=A0A8J8NXR8_HALGN|nr:hypothetical protein FGO68_gene3284 [Halteria grandinella]
MLEALQEMHEAGFLHQDVKPNNFRITEDNRIIMLDFGLINEYQKSGRHKEKGKYGFQGTPLYGSINALKEYTLSRRDDLESLGYSIMTLIDKNSVPWIKMSKMKDILISKVEFLKRRNVEPKFLTIQRYLRMVSSLRYEEEPEYLQYKYYVLNLDQGENEYLNSFAEKALKTIIDRYFCQIMREAQEQLFASAIARLSENLLQKENFLQISQICRNILR